MSTIVKADETVLLAKVETAYGTDANTDAASDAILTQDFAITPLQASTIERNLDRPGYGANPMMLSGVHVACNFNLELSGGGTIDAPVPYNSILKGCARSETVEVGTRVIYAPQSDDFDSLTLDVHLDGLHHQVTGWRGSVGVNIAAGSLPTLSVQGLGLYVDPAQIVPPSNVDFSAFEDPIPVEYSNTTATINGLNLPTVNFSVGNGDQVNYRNLINQEAVTVDGRSLTGTMEVLMDENLSNFNPYELAKSGDFTAITVTHGATPGHIIELDAPRVQIESVDMGTNGGERTWRLGVRLIASDAGNDELMLITR